MDSKKRYFLASAGIGILAVVLLTASNIMGGQIQLNQRMLIQGIGVDAREDGVLVSVHISEPLEEGKTMLEQAEGDTVLSALDNLVQRTGKVPLYSHNLVVVFGEECARTGLDRYLDFFVRYYETRPSVSLFLAEGEAREIFEFQKEEQYLDDEILVRIGESGKENGWTVQTRVIDFVNQQYGEGSSPYLPLLSIQEDTLEATGTAVFQSDVYCGTLSPEESRVLLLLTKPLSGGQIVTELPEAGKITLSIRSGSSDIQSEIRDGAPFFTINASFALSVSSMEKGVTEEEPFLQTLSSQLEEEIRQQIEKVLQKTLQQLHTDPVGFGRLLMQQQTAWWKAHRENWEDWMEKAQFSIQTQAEVGRIETEFFPAG